LNQTVDQSFLNQVYKQFDIDCLIRNAVVESYVLSDDNVFSGNNYNLYNDKGFWRLVPYDLEYIFSFPDTTVEKNVF
jgi:hypothetical protein